MKKILITGGTGYLGRNLAIFYKKKYKVFLGARNNKQNFLVRNLTNCEVVPLDVSNLSSVNDCLNYAKPDIVIHAAATKFVDLSEKFPFECIDTNIVGSTNVARACLNKKVPKDVNVKDFLDQLGLVSHETAPTNIDEEQLNQLKSLLEQGIISQEEYDDATKAIKQ